MTSTWTLNPPQAEAVAHHRGALLVFAGAGSGKTRVITYRIANLMATHHVAPHRILAVTFTNKAASEMKRRIEKIAGDELSRDLWVGTFHATCAKLLRRHGESVGLAKNFTIYDADDQKTLVSRILRDLDLDEKRFAPRVALHRIQQEKQEGRGPNEFSVDNYLDEQLLKIFRAYETRLEAAMAVDFEDLIGKTVRLAEHPEHGKVLRFRFEHLLVDEFQDTNRMQYRLVKALAGEHRNLCVVGDDDQSIYRWRGADVRNIRGFRRDFPEVRVVKLEQNYRSTKNIVETALAVISASPEREPKNLFTENVTGEPVDLVATRTEHEEAAVAVDAIRAAVKDGVSLSDVAVFYRIHAQSRVLEDALRLARIPYQVIGGMKFYERMEVKDALAYLRLLVNPRSDLDLLRVINTPARGIGDSSVEKLVHLSRTLGTSLFEGLALVERAAEIGAAPKKRLVQFHNLLRDLRAEADTLRPSELLDRVLTRTGYKDALKGDGSVESETRLENLGELLGSLRDFETECEAGGEQPSLELFLERATLAGADDASEGDRASLMTVHAAKGLEFDWVILTGMEEEMFPYRGLSPREHEELEEERRLAYVALSRARKRLVLTYTGTRQIFGTTRYGRPSRFLDDLPQACILQRTASGVSQRPPPVSQPVRWDASLGPPAAPRPRVEPGARFVDREFFDDEPGGGLHQGSRVRHDRFGEGKVLQMTNLGEPAVVAYFPGWGERKVLLRFLKIA